MSLYATLSAVLVTFLLTRFLLSKKIAGKLQDVPNDRSLHSTPVPRIGGLSLLAGTSSGWVWLFNDLVWWIVVPLFVLFAISLLDDLRSLPVRHRLLAHLAAAFILVAGSGITVQQGMVTAVILLLFVVWMTNLFNFMDGSDGLAAGMALFGFATLGMAAWLAHNPVLATLNFSISAAAAGLLYYNFYPAKVFMGDAGSIPLGFLAAAMSLLGWQQSSWEPWFPVLVFSPFIFDASVTLFKRIVRGIRVTKAHREHYYQRLIRMGWSHRKVALTAYALMLAVCISALWAKQYGLAWPIPVAWCAIYAVLMWRVDKRWKNTARGDND